MTLKERLQAFKQRWETEESKVGKLVKYYVGYVFIGAGWVTLHTPEITGLFMQAGMEIPPFIPKVFLGCGIVAYIGSKLTVAKKN